MIEFPDRQRFERWATSDDYREIATDRMAATEATVLLVRGLARSFASGSIETTDSSVPPDSRGA